MGRSLPGVGSEGFSSIVRSLPGDGSLGYSSLIRSLSDDGCIEDDGQTAGFSLICVEIAATVGA